MDSAPSPTSSMVERIPDDIRSALSSEQVNRLAKVMAQSRDHGMAWRASTRVLGRRFYVAILSGQEHRAHRRLRADGQLMGLARVLARIVIASLWITGAFLIVAMAGVVLIYLVKSILGIDLMDGPSPLHAFFFN